MRHQKLNRLAALRRGQRLATHEPGVRSILRLDYGPELLGTSTGDEMFKRMEKDMVVVIDTFGFPIVGRVLEWDDTSVTLVDGVRILYDGRHGEFAAGAARVPASAEIEQTYSPYIISADDVRGWGPYAGGEIPKPQ